MSPEDFAPLNISQYELRLRAEEACSLPSFLGSTLRGAFGHALRQAVSALDGCDCNGCSAADPCTYHYLFETPVPPNVTQLRGQREAPVPFILSPPIVENPVRRVWKVPAVRAAGALSGSAELGGFARNSSNPQSANRDSQSSPTPGDSAELGVVARNPSNPQSAIRNPQVAITSVTFPDQPRRFKRGDELSFDLTLIGRAINYLPHVVFAISGMARCGLGATRARFELKEVWLKSAAGSSERVWANGVFLGAQASRPPDVEAERSRLVQIARPLTELIRERLAELKFEPSQENSICSPSLENTIADALRELGRGDGNGSNSGNGNSAGRLGLRTNPQPPAPNPQPPTPEPQPLSPNPQGLRLRFFTPARIRVQGDLQTDLSFELLVRNLLRRVSTLAAVHGRGPLDLDYRGLIEHAKPVVTVGSHLRWWDLERYTNRQGGKLRVGGFIGEVEYEGEAIAEFLPLLVAGELLSIGTGTSFGLGSYRILEYA